VIFNETAKEKKLINETGGIDKAVERAGNNAGLKDYPVWTIEKEESFCQFIFTKKFYKFNSKDGRAKSFGKSFFEVWDCVCD
jgi:ClpP class serine protease